MGSIGPGLAAAAVLSLAACSGSPTGPANAPGVGGVAPDIAGVDLDGVPFRLSDYKGKVIFLDFWGDW